MRQVLHNNWLKKKVIGSLFFSIFLIVFYFSLPANLFKSPYSLVVLDKYGDLLGARIANDGQWRFKSDSVVSDKFNMAIIEYEDAWFNYHLGINPVSIFRALGQNLKAGRVKSGASTISMQVIRLSRHNSRTYFEKILEMILAVRMEFRYSKDEILNLYSNHAPFGGNVVGISAASWRYFGRSADELSWAEACTLAVLPNNPGMIHPGRNREALKIKRNFLLKKLLKSEIIDSLTYQLSIVEDLPEKPFPLPNVTPHLLTTLSNTRISESVVYTTIDKKVQEKATEIVEKFHSNYSKNEIHNGAALIINVKTGEVLAYVGNTKAGNEHGENVDIIQSQRSTGSLLKPFLYTQMVHEGLLMPKELVPDIPTFIDGFAPENFSGSFDGAVHADEALYRSLNVPAVLLLKQYRYERFYNRLKEMGMESLSKPADHYGLSLILGGAESSLWELSKLYFEMVSSLKEDIGIKSISPHYISGLKDSVIISAFDEAAVWHTLLALKKVERPESERNWEVYANGREIAWKTGTSFGHRDAWAIGVTPDYVVGTWFGNADGEGRNGLTGVSVAAPVMFELFTILPVLNSDFRKPEGQFVKMKVCVQSGKKAGELCTEIREDEVLKNALRTTVCDFHEWIHLDNEGKFRVLGNCYPVSEMIHKSWFLLPPVQHYYFSRQNPSYAILPSWKSGCFEEDSKSPMRFIYPQNNAKIFIPRNLDGENSHAIFEVAHNQNNIAINWHLDGEFLGQTRGLNKMEFNKIPGKHNLTIVDENGNIHSINFTVIAQEY